MRKGVILEVGKSSVTVITPEGEYMRTRRLQQDYCIGEEIYFYPISEKSNRKPWVLTFFKNTKGRFVALSAATIIVLTTVLFPIYENSVVYAYMSIDVNPSIELGLNEDFEVISIEGYNTEGKTIAGQISDWKHKSAAVVAEKIIEEIDKRGFLKEESNLLIATIPIEEEEKKQIDSEMKETITKLKKAVQDDEVEVTVLNGTAEERETAVMKGVTTGTLKQDSKKALQLDNKKEPSVNEQPQKEPLNQPKEAPDQHSGQENSVIKQEQAKANSKNQNHKNEISKNKENASNARNKGKEMQNNGNNKFKNTGNNGNNKNKKSENRGNSKYNNGNNWNNKNTESNGNNKNNNKENNGNNNNKDNRNKNGNNKNEQN